ncbi:cullin-like protein, partial [Trifolium medium]|nr:cullin-like protein [Trifolium medium]
MASSSAPVGQNPLNSMDLPPIATIGKSLIYTGDVMQFNIGLLKLRPEKMVDFESLKINGFDFEELFTNQGWKRYFDMPNGPIYTNMVKEFWMKAYVYDKIAARTEEEQLILKDPSLKGKSRAEMGLNTFNGTVIKSVLAGLEITISKAHFAKLLEVKDQGKRIADYKNEIYYRQSIKKELYLDESSAGKSRSM